MTDNKMIPAMRDLLKTRYDITGNLKQLPGDNETDLVDTYLVEADTDVAYLFKPVNEDTATGVVEIQHLAVETLMQAELGIMPPRVILTREGDVTATVRTDDGNIIRGRLLSFVQGLPWCSDVPASPERLQDLGRTIGRMSTVLSAIIHPDNIRTHPWDLAAADQHRVNICKIEIPARRQILERVFLWYAAIARPKFHKMPRGLIHGGINAENVLIQGNRVTGLLNFANCLDNPLINDLAIALAGHILNEPDSLDAAAQVVGAYHRERPLSRDEIKVLFPLMCTRLAVTAIISATQQRTIPDRIWHQLTEFSNITPAAAARALAAHTDLKPYAGQGTATGVLAERRKSCIAPSIGLSYTTPIKMVQGRAQYLYDAAGHPYLDLYNNVCHVGHCHPHVVAEGQKQMARLNTNTRYLYDGLIEYAERLTATLPVPLDTCFFVNSGSEANELALRIARTVTGRRDVLVVDNAYHGHTQAMVHISPYKFMGKGGTGDPEPWVHVVPVADGYRGRFKGTHAATGKAYGDEVGNTIADQGISPAAFITESLLSCGGQVIPPASYFQTAFAHVRKAGGLCICDEVQTGFGRTGSHFWAFERQGVVPDIVVMGKPMGNGHPLSAVVTSRAIADAFANGMEFFATFGGNPVSCAIGMAVLDVIENEALRENARDVGRHMMSGLASLKKHHHLMGDVRGTGLFIGIELVADRDTLAPATDAAAKVVNRLKEEGILLGTDGPFSNVIKIKPPLVITRQDADHFVRTFDDILTGIDG